MDLSLTTFEFNILYNLIILVSMTEEVIAVLYGAAMFTPGFILRWFTLIQVLLPLLDFSTDVFTAGKFQFTLMFLNL